ncbi:hypothetical protein AcV7_010459 [Taiwanofungus camphoratus]|nr:hypothetical protein AcV7_010459 [Antrodia cinnamomea]
MYNCPAIQSNPSRVSKTRLYKIEHSTSTAFNHDECEECGIYEASVLIWHHHGVLRTQQVTALHRIYTVTYMIYDTQGTMKSKHSSSKSLPSSQEDHQTLLKTNGPSSGIACALPVRARHDPTKFLFATM